MCKGLKTAGRRETLEAASGTGNWIGFSSGVYDHIKCLYQHFSYQYILCRMTLSTHTHALPVLLKI